MQTTRFKTAAADGSGDGEGSSSPITGEILAVAIRPYRDDGAGVNVAATLVLETLGESEEVIIGSDAAVVVGNTPAMIYPRRGAVDSAGDDILFAASGTFVPISYVCSGSIKATMASGTEDDQFDIVVYYQ